ncbi:MAG: DinB family protein [Gemmatimonadaceae bacterium]
MTTTDAPSAPAARAASELEAAVEGMAPRLLALPPAVRERRPAPGKWSVAEIVGHLVDSAANNHQRFVRARFQDDLVFPGYAQDGWVDAQGYQAAPWEELVTLWRTYNRHLARLMRLVPRDVATREHRRHNLHEIAWRTVPADQPATLEYFMADYVGHLKHHLAQIEILVR